MIYFSPHPHHSRLVRLLVPYAECAHFLSLTTDHDPDANGPPFKTDAPDFETSAKNLLESLRDTSGVLVVLDISSFNDSPTSRAFPIRLHETLLLFRLLISRRTQISSFILLSQSFTAPRPAGDPQRTLSAVDANLPNICDVIHGMLRVFRRETGLDDTVWSVDLPSLDTLSDDILDRVISKEMHPRTDGSASDRAVVYRQSDDGGIYRAIPVLQELNDLDHLHEVRGTTLIIGFGSIGSALALALTGRGCKVVLIGRRPHEEVEVSLSRLQQATNGLCDYIQADVCNFDSLHAAMTAIQTQHGSIENIVHTAAVIKDATIPNVENKAFDSVLNPKVIGAWNIHLISKEVCPALKTFTLLSSISVSLGNQGQIAYVAGNSYMEALASYRQSRGMPGVCIQLGAWESKLVEDLHAANHLMTVVDNKTGIPLILKAMAAPIPVQVIANLDLNKLASIPAYSRDSLFKEVLPQPSSTETMMPDKFDQQEVIDVMSRIFRTVLELRPSETFVSRHSLDILPRRRLKQLLQSVGNSASMGSASDNDRPAGGTSRSGARTPRKVQWMDVHELEQRSSHMLDESGLDPDAFLELTDALQRHQITTPLKQVHYYSPQSSEPSSTNSPEPEVLRHHARGDSFSLYLSSAGSSRTFAPHSLSLRSPSPTHYVPGNYIGDSEDAGLPGTKDLRHFASKKARTVIRGHIGTVSAHGASRSQKGGSKLRRGGHPPEMDPEGASESSPGRGTGILTTILSLYGRPDAANSYTDSEGFETDVESTDRGWTSDEESPEGTQGSGKAEEKGPGEKKRKKFRLPRAAMKVPSMFGHVSRPTAARNAGGIQSAAKVLDIELSFLYLPDVVLLSFDDSGTGTSHIKLIRQCSGLDLGKLNDAFSLYWKVIHDKLSVSDASVELDNLMRKKPLYNWWQLVIIGGFCSASICTLSFGGSFADALMSFPLGGLLISIQLLSVRNVLYSHVFEVTATTLFSFIAAALAASHRICYSAIASSSVVLILPGFLVLTGALELMSRNIISGSVRLCFAIVYALFLGFGFTIGAELYELSTSHQVYGAEDYTCSLSHRPDGPWYQRTPSQYWAFLTVPMFSMFLSMRNQAPWNKREMPLLIAIASTGWVTNYFTGKKFSGQSDIIAAVGAFAVGLVANIYARIFSGNAFVVMASICRRSLLPAGNADSGLTDYGYLVSAPFRPRKRWAAELCVSASIWVLRILSLGLQNGAKVGSRKREAGIFSM
ncbi:hypothetical protein NLJ89_g1987 [Agrocybe chaxingu]|uniref:Ketoreductase domain-containing protein n=1 Tax=Agrocybe chaxingu TaxID=84603 RepID=A0A9W8TCI8_9AGAR|nr:hypothetical protein NLJ89_g1987 [Agrocybe chaxingu]